MGKRKTETNERTPEELIEQHAHDIIASCEAIKRISAGWDRATTFLGWERQFGAARSAQFHAEGILSALKWSKKGLEVQS